MVERALMSGNEACGRGALDAGVELFFGYPITPQSEIMEFIARELPKAGGVFLQSECELATAGMVFGASHTGKRAMTASSGPGVSLMQEFVSLMSFTQLPAVIVDVVRFGPGTGSGQTSQTDYRQLTKGGGHGGYRCVVFAPWSAQECYELTQKAFYLADKYRMVVYVMTDFTVGQSTEMVEIKGSIDFGPLPSKEEWALVTPSNRDGKLLAMGMGQDMVGYHLSAIEKYNKVSENEVMYDTYMTEDAEILLASFGYAARMAQGAVDLARAEGLKVGLFRPITCWPFPSDALKDLASRVKKILVVEHNSGLMVDDVEIVVQGSIPVHLLGIWGCHVRGGSGLIYPERILQEVKSLP